MHVHDIVIVKTLMKGCPKMDEEIKTVANLTPDEIHELSPEVLIVCESFRRLSVLFFCVTLATSRVDILLEASKKN